MHSEEILKSAIFSRRAFIMGVGKLSLLSLLASRMYYLQILKSDKFKTLSENNCIRAVYIPALRGNIVDRYGSPLAINQNHYRVMFDKSSGANVNQALDKLIKILPLKEEEVAYIAKRIANHRTAAPMLLYSPLTWQDVVNIEVNAHKLPGIYVDVGQVRFYPFSNLCAHIIGHVAAPNEEELSKHALLNHPDVKIGKGGVEKIFNSHLTGEAGIKRMEVNAYGLPIRELSKEDASAGRDISLTIDIGLQDFVTNKLDPRGSAAVVIDIKNGDILSLCSTPAYDPNQFTQGITNKYWNELLNDPYHPFINKAISVNYPPGSIFKVIVAIAGLEEGVTPETTIHCSGHIMVGDRKVHCWKVGGHGTLNMTQAISYSCNCYFLTIVKKIGIDKLAQMARRFSFGEKTNIDLPGESAAIAPDKKWKRKKYNQEWHIGDTLNISIGQGFMQATPLQLAIMTARIASGKMIMPHLVNKPDIVFPEMEVDPKHLAIIRKGMDGVVNIPGATAYANRITEAPFTMGGKTGTSQVISKKNEKDDFSKESTLWKNKNHGLFVGFAPVINPRYACSVIIEHGGSGSGAASPVARDIFVELHRLFPDNFLTS